MIEALELEEKGSIRDLINQAEKNELISSAADFIRIRELRNLIAHEYQEDDLNMIFKEVKVMTPLVVDAIAKVIEFSKRYEA